MRKMPCLFQRDFKDKRSFTLLRDVTPGCEWVLAGEGVATVKRDGTACAVIGGKLHKRYDAKSGKPVPVNGIACDEPDLVTGHWPHWVPVGDEPASQWHREAWDARRVAAADGSVIVANHIPDGTYELCGPKLQSNPEGFANHVLIQHGTETFADGSVPRDFDGLRGFLEAMRFEGLVFWRERGNPSAPMVKIRRADFGLPWPLARGVL